MAEESTTAPPRTYNRGNDKIDMDAYIQAAKAEWDFWLANSRLKNKQKQEAQEAFDQMIKGIEDGTVTYNAVKNRGFNNTIGITNSSGFDAAGLAAMVLGKELRKQQVIPTTSSETPTTEAPTLSAQQQAEILANELQEEAKQEEVKQTEVPTELEWAVANFPEVKDIKTASMSLEDANKYGQFFRTRLDNQLKQLDPKILLGMINFSLQHDPAKYPLWNDPNIAQAITVNGKVYPFSNQYILQQILKTLKDHHKVLDNYKNGNQYYIMKSYNKKRGTGVVWDISDNSLKELTISQIPYITNYIHNKYLEAYPKVVSHKEGGTIEKFQSGGWFEQLYKQKALGSWNDQLSNVKWIKGTKRHGRASDLSSVAEANTAYTADHKAIGEDINNFVNNSGLFEENLTPEQIVARYNENAGKIRGFWENQTVDYKSTNALDHNKLFKQMFGHRSDTSGNGNENYNLSYQDGDVEGVAGSQTWHRRMDRYEKEYDQLTDEEKKARTYTITRMVNGVPQTFEVYKKANGDIAILNDLVDLKDNLRKDIEEQIKQPTSLSTPITPTSSVVDEREDLTPPEQNIGQTGFLQRFRSASPNIIDAARWLMSLRANSKVFNEIKPSLKPVLKNTYEKYSPVTGAYSIWQGKNSQAADIMSASNRSFTSDASLAAARMNEGQRQANLLSMEGRIADDQEIKRTMAEARNRVEDNMARRTDVANYNRQAINQARRELAQLSAARIKNDWQTTDNYLAGLVSRIRSEQERDESKRSGFQSELSRYSVERWKASQMEEPNRELQAWMAEQTAKGITPDITKWGKYNKYIEYKRRVSDMAQDKLYSDMGRILNMPYNYYYTNDAYKALKWQ